MRAALLLMLPAVALAGCGETATGNAAGAANAVAENAADGNTAFVGETRGWSDLFAKPASDALAVFEKLSLRPGAYEEMGGMMMSHGAPIALTDGADGKRNTLTFNASGDASTLNGVSFDIYITDAANAEAARARAIQSIGAVLRTAGLDGESVVEAALAPDARAVAGTVAGANYAVVRKDARTTITFTKQST